MFDFMEILPGLINIIKLGLETTSVRKEVHKLLEEKAGTASFQIEEAVINIVQDCQKDVPEKDMRLKVATRLMDTFSPRVGRVILSKGMLVRIEAAEAL